MKIRDAVPGDIPAILSIYNQAIRETTASWASNEETLDDRITWFESRRDNGLPVIVAVNSADIVTGFASYGPFRANHGYRFTAEHSIYVDPAQHRNGIGSNLLAAIIDRAKDGAIHVLVGGVDRDNAASIALHEKFGFEVTGSLPEVGAKFGRWLDLALMTKVLDQSDTPPGT